MCGSEGRGSVFVFQVQARQAIIAGLVAKSVSGVLVKETFCHAVFIRVGQKCEVGKVGFFSALRGFDNRKDGAGAEQQGGLIGVMFGRRIEE